MYSDRNVGLDKLGRETVEDDYSFQLGLNLLFAQIALYSFTY